MDLNASRETLYRDATRGVILGLIINIMLGVVKLVGGIVGRSFALIADAVNSLGDVFVSVVILAAFRVAQRPADKAHPYGHTRAEAIAGSNVALIIIFSALVVGWEAINRFSKVHETLPVWTLWIAAGNVIIKESLYWYKVRLGRRTGSRAVLANAWDHRSDALCSFAVLVGLACVIWGGPGLDWADEAAALIVVAFILWGAIRLFLHGASELMDMQPESAFVQQVKEVILSVPEVRLVETIRIRKSGLEYFADIHIEVDPEMTVQEGHRVGHQVKDRVMHKFGCIRDVLVHLEPHERVATR